MSLSKKHGKEDTNTKTKPLAKGFRQITGQASVHQIKVKTRTTRAKRLLEQYSEVDIVKLCLSLSKKSTGGNPPSAMAYFV